MKATDQFTFTLFIPSANYVSQIIFPIMMQALDFNPEVSIEPIDVAVNDDDEAYLLCRVQCSVTSRMIPTILTIDESYDFAHSNPRTGYYSTFTLYASNTGEAHSRAQDCPASLLESARECGYEFTELQLCPEWVSLYESGPKLGTEAELFAHKSNY